MLFGGLLASALAVGTYYPFLRDFFALDDFVGLYLVERRDLAAVLRDAFALPQALSFGVSPFWRPVGMLYFYVAETAFGLHPLGYHVTNVLLHGLNAILLAVLVRTLSRSAFAAATAAIVFAVLPTYDIAVLWISQTFELLVATFGLASLTLFAAYVRYGRPRRLLYGAALVTALLALLAKESGPFLLVVLFPMIVILDGWPGVRRNWRVRTAELIPFALLVGSYSLFIFLQERPLGISTYDVGPQVARNLWVYLRWMTLPIPRGWGSWVGVASQFTAVLLLMSTVLALVTRRALVTFFVLWIFVVLLPVLPFATGVELRYTYLPSLALAALLGLGVDALRRRLMRARFRWANAAVALAVLTLAVFLSTRAREQQGWLRAQAFLAQTLVEDVGSQCGMPLPKNIIVLNSPIPDPYGLRLRSAVNLYQGGGADIQVTGFQGGSLPPLAVFIPDRCVLTYYGGHYRLVEATPSASSR